MTAYELKKHAYGSSLKSRALSVLMYLIDRANKEMICFPSIQTMARQLHISVSTVKRALKELELAGYLQRDSRWRDNGGQSSNLYTLAAPPQEQPKTENKQPQAAAADIYDCIISQEEQDRPLLPAQRSGRDISRLFSAAPYSGVQPFLRDSCAQLSFWTGVGFNLRPP